MKKLILVAVSVFCLAATSAQSAQKPMNLTYDVYAGGFKALAAEMSLDLDSRAYDIGLEAKTQGFIGDLFPWEASFNTSGKSAKNGQPVPTLSLMKSTWKNSTKLTEMSYDPKGRVLKTTTKDGEITNVARDIDRRLSGDAVDMLTGTLMMMRAAQNNQTCAGSYGVFDGKRRFNIKLKDEGKETIAKSKYSTFSGPAMKCTVRVEPVAGFSDKDKKRGWLAVQKHTEKHEKATTIWFARLNNKGPVVPVRMEIASDYGSVVAHLATVK